MKKPLIVANWKMNPVTLREAKLNFGLIKKAARRFKGVETVICPPFIYLSVLKANGAQDCFWEPEKGSFTSAISPLMLKNLGCRYVILGHSERRVYFKEDDRMINKKMKAALTVGLKVILCVGEKKQGNLLELQRQLQTCLTGIGKSDFKNLTVAYEPIWAISGFGGKPASVDEVGRGVHLIKKALNSFFKKSAANKIRILYGGSASQGARSYIHEAKIGGLVIGASSAKASAFIDIIKAVC